MEYIYFDNGATTKPSAKCLEAFNSAALEHFANPSALHIAGLDAEKIIRSAASEIGGLLKVSPDEIYFTSGGTESNNLAIFSLARLRIRSHKHVITSLVEHPSVTEVFRQLEKDGFQVTWLKAEGGNIKPEQVEAALRDDTALVSIMHVNNETGAINDIAAIGEIVKKHNQAKFHVDGVQAMGKIPVNLKNIDSYSFSAHKIHGLKGVGGLYFSKKNRGIPQILGGGQSKGFRSGTENVPGIYSTAVAVKDAFENMENNYRHVTVLKEKFLEISRFVEGVHINGGGEKASPYIVNLSFRGVKSEVMLHALAEEGLLVSAGSACSSNKKDLAGNIIANMGYPKEIYESALRISFSAENTLDEVQKAWEIIIGNVEKLRKYSKR